MLLQIIHTKIMKFILRKEGRGAGREEGRKEGKKENIHKTGNPILL